MRIAALALYASGWPVALGLALGWLMELVGSPVNPHGGGILLALFPLVAGLAWVPCAAAVTLLRLTRSARVSGWEWALLGANTLMVAAVFIVNLPRWLT
jgi:hypothetical protein